MARVGEYNVKGLDAYVKALEAFPAEAAKAVSRGLLRSAEEMMGEFKATVPVAQGTLRDSGRVPLPTVRTGRVEIEFGFYAPYAYVTHQNPRSGHTQGRSPSRRKYPPGTWAAVGDPLFVAQPGNAYARSGRVTTNVRTELQATIQAKLGKKFS